MQNMIMKPRNTDRFRPVSRESV